MGDAIVYKAYDKNKTNLDIGDVIVFDKAGTQTVHRITEIKKYNDEYRYYTKGDANSRQDDGYVTVNQIIGKVKFRIKYIGYPTLLVRRAFNQK